MEKAIDVIKNILEEELDVISEEKRDFVAARITKELNLDKTQILSDDSLPKKSGSFDLSNKQKAKG